MTARRVAAGRAFTSRTTREIAMRLYLRLAAVFVALGLGAIGVTLSGAAQGQSTMVVPR